MGKLNRCGGWLHTITPGILILVWIVTGSVKFVPLYLFLWLAAAVHAGFTHFVAIDSMKYEEEAQQIVKMILAQRGELRRKMNDFHDPN